MAKTKVTRLRTKSKTRRRVSPWERLSFIADRKKAGLPEGRFPRCFWNVKPTGDYVEDCDTGQRLALEYLRFIAAGNVPDLPAIVGDMPRPLTGIEVGFLSLVGSAAQTGFRPTLRLTQLWTGPGKSKAA